MKLEIGKNNPRVLAAFARAQNNPDLKIVLEAIDTLRQEAQRACCFELDDRLALQAQGAFQALDTVIKTAEQARERLEKVEFSRLATPRHT